MSPLWLIILLALLNCGKIAFLFTLEIVTPQQKAFCGFEFTKTNVIVMVHHAFTKEFGIDLPHSESI